MAYIEMVNKIYEDYKENGTLSKESGELLEQLHAELNKPVEAKPLTENCIKILTFMQEEPNKTYISKTIAEGMGVSARSVSGSMRKLVNDGYVKKASKDPIVYALTDMGKEFSN